MVGAGEVAGAALVGADDAVAPVAAHIQVSSQAALAVAAQDDRLLAHIGVEVIVGPRHQRLVADHQPGSSEDLFLLFGVYVGIDKNAPVKLTCFHVNNLIVTANGNHRGTPGRRMIRAFATVSIILCILSIGVVE